MGIMNGWNDIALISPSEDIDISSVPALRAQVDTLIAAGTQRILINCQSVSFIDSTGMAFLLSRARKLMMAGGLLSMVNVAPEVMRFMEIARLADALHASGAKRSDLPMLAGNATPLVDRSFSICEGIENLGDYRKKVLDVLNEVPMDRDGRFDLTLAVSEALGNVYDHAGAAGSVMRIRAYADRVMVEVSDRGAGYSIASDETPEQSEERGRGIKLMRMLCDSVEVRRRTDTQGTFVTLVKLY